MKVWQYLCLMLVVMVPMNKCSTLVLLDSLNLLNSHSHFLNHLSQVDDELIIKTILNPQLKLKQFDEYLYHTIVVMSTSDPSNQVHNKRMSQQLLDFYDQGGNLLIIPTKDISQDYLNIFTEMGVHLIIDSSTQQVLEIETDNAQTDFGHHSIKYTGGILKPSIYENDQQYIMLHTQQSHLYSLENMNHPIPILPLMITSIGNNNARCILSASLDLFSDVQYSTSQQTVQFISQSILPFLYQQSHRLRITESKHYLTDDQSQTQQHHYKIKDEVTYMVKLQEMKYDQSRYQYSPQLQQIQPKYNHSWVGHHTDQLQMEFVMLDAYVRKNMTKVSNNGWYKCQFIVPDQHGVFQFKVNYNPPLHTIISKSDKIPIRPFKHNEYPRFLPVAFVYYCASWSTIIGFLFFFSFLLYSQPPKSKTD